MDIQPDDFVFSISYDGEMMVTMRGDGRMEFGPNYNPDITAKIFWDTIKKTYPRTLSNEVVDLGPVKH